VNQSILKFLAFDQVFKNALTPCLSAGRRGVRLRAQGQVRRRGDALLPQFYGRNVPARGTPHRHPGGDIGVGSREIGYLFGAYKKLSNQFTGALTGKGLAWGGSLFRPEAAGYGCVYFAAEMLATRGMGIEEQTCLVSGSGNVAQHTAEKLIQLGAKVLTLSDSAGHISTRTASIRKSSPM